MISTGKVVLDLWMHYSKPIDISNCVLTETMARCLELHRSNVRYKLAEVARFLIKRRIISTLRFIRILLGICIEELKCNFYG